MGEDKQEKFAKMLAECDGNVIKDLDLSSEDLRGVHMHDVEFNNVKFDSANISKSTIKGVKFIGCSFVGTVMKHCNVKDSNIESSTIENCNMTGTHMGGVEFEGVTFRGVELEYAEQHCINCVDSDFKDSEEPYFSMQDPVTKLFVGSLAVGLLLAIPGIMAFISPALIVKLFS